MRIIKIHIYNKFDSIDKIINTYAISLNDLKKFNPKLDLFNLKEGDRLIIKKNEEIKEKITISNKEEYQKYLCPHCKKVILIPK